MRPKSLLLTLFLFSALLSTKLFGHDGAAQDTTQFRMYLDSANWAETNGQLDLCVEWLKKAEAEFDTSLPRKTQRDYHYIYGSMYLATWQLEKAEVAFLKSIAISSASTDSISLLNDYAGLATVFSSQGRVQEAINYHRLSLSYFLGKDSVRYFSVLSNLAIAHENSNEPDKALPLYIQAKSFFASEGNFTAEAVVESNIGELYRNHKLDPVTAKYHYRNAIELNKKGGSKSGLVQNYHNLGLAFSMSEQLDSSFFYIRKSLRLRNEIGESGGVALSLYALANNFLLIEELDSAEWAYKETLRISQELGIDPGVYYANGGLGRLYQKMGKTRLADGHFRESLKAAEHTGSLGFQQEAFNNLYEFYKETGKSDEALEAYESYQGIVDSLRIMQSEKELEEVLAKYRMDLAEAENETLRAEQGLRKAQITRQRGFLLGLIVLLIVLVAGWAILVRAYRQRNQAFVEVVEAKRELEVQYDRTKEQELKLLEASSLKNRIFSVLGHDLRAPLVNIASMLELISADTIRKDELTWIFRHLRRDTDQSINTLNNILQWSQMQMSDLRVRREKVELKEAFSDLKEIFESSTRLKNLNLTFDDLSESGQIWVDPNQFRSIATNLISNAIKFSPVGEEVKVAITENERYSVLRISDNGEGFPDEPVPISGNYKTTTSAGTMGETGTGVGLQIVRDFVEAHQGEIVMSKNPDGGALVEVFFPRSQDSKKQGGAQNSLRSA